MSSRYPILDETENDSVIEPVDDHSIAMVDQEVEHMEFAASVNVTEDLIRSSTKETAVALTEGVLTENQVSEVNPSFGSQVISDSVSCNFVSTNQKNEIKNTVIANGDKLEQEIVRSKMVEEPLSTIDVPVYDESHSMDVQEPDQKKVSVEEKSQMKLEQEIVRSKMVEEPSSTIDVPVYDESHSMDVGEPDEKKVSVEENTSINRRPNLNKTNGKEDVGYPEKFNLDGNSDDESVDEDMPEIKQFDSKFNNELGEKWESAEITNVKEHATVVVIDGLSSEGGTYHNNDIPSVSPVKKHKFPDQTSVENNKSAKRQRWNSVTVKGSNTQRSTVKPATAPRGEPISLKCNFSLSDSPAIDDAPKERIVPPSQRPPTNSLRIDGFLRPFTLKAVQGLLGKTGNFTSFWMDVIKTHCYVSYTTVEEAVETRNAVYNLQWPPNVGHLLVAEYVEPEDVKMKLEPPPPVDFVNNDATASPVPVTLPPPQLLSKLPPAARERLPPPPSLSLLPPVAREQLPHPPPLSELPPPPREWRPLPPPREWRPPLSNLSPDVRERIPSTPPLPKKGDKPIVTVDDFFPKTRATPQIYYLPLSDEQVAAKTGSNRQRL